jgi:hypothetical protein
MDSRIVDITGKRFGTLVVIEDDGTRDNRGGVKWLCRCDCGRMLYVEGENLRSGNSRSCGDFKSGHHTRQWNTSDRRTYFCYSDIKKRCSYPKHSSYRNYGGKGIKICERWKDSYENFLEDLGQKPEGMVLERIDKTKDYEPGNCRWSYNKQLHSKENRNNKDGKENGKWKILSKSSRLQRFLKLLRNTTKVWMRRGSSI